MTQVQFKESDEPTKDFTRPSGLPYQKIAEYTFPSHTSTVGLDTQCGQFRVIAFCGCVLVIRRRDGCVVCITYELPHALAAIQDNQDQFLHCGGLTEFDKAP